MNFFKWPRRCYTQFAGRGIDGNSILDLADSHYISFLGKSCPSGRGCQSATGLEPSVGTASVPTKASTPMPMDTPPRLPLPQAIKIPNQPYTIRWQDGREAVFKQTYVDTPIITTQFKVTDNTCSNRQNMTCSYKFALRQIWYSLVWTKNPDPARIGKIIEKVDRQDSSVLKVEIDYVYFAGLPVADQKNREMGSSDTIECRDFLLVTRRENSASYENLFVSRWDGEETSTKLLKSVVYNENRSHGWRHYVELVTETETNARK